MFGKNQIAHERHDAQTLLVQGHVWTTIQGEGPLAGEPAIFLRLAGCNLRCFFCDTDFESKAKEWSPEGVAQAIEIQRTTFGGNLLVVTGGEPLLQNIPALICALDEHAPHIKRIQIETAGSVWPDGLEEYMISATRADQKRRAHVSIVVSPKTPEIHPQVRAYAMAWKYIIDANALSEDDGLPLMNTQGELKYARAGKSPLATMKPLARPRIKPVQIFVQPMDVEDPVQKAKNISATVQTALKHGYRLSFQMHKHLGVE